MAGVAGRDGGGAARRLRRQVDADDGGVPLLRLEVEHDEVVVAQPRAWSPPRDRISAAGSMRRRSAPTPGTPRGAAARPAPRRPGRGLPDSAPSVPWRSRTGATRCASRARWPGTCWRRRARRWCRSTMRSRTRSEAVWISWSKRTSSRWLSSRRSTTKAPAATATPTIKVATGRRRLSDFRSANSSEATARTARKACMSSSPSCRVASTKGPTPAAVMIVSGTAIATHAPGGAAQPEPVAGQNDDRKGQEHRDRRGAAGTARPAAPRRSSAPGRRSAAR